MSEASQVFYKYVQLSHVNLKQQPFGLAVKVKLLLVGHPLHISQCSF